LRTRTLLRPRLIKYDPCGTGPWVSRARRRSVGLTCADQLLLGVQPDTRASAAQWFVLLIRMRHAVEG